eukprot:COSAG06_NODE_1603_length_8956_cov_6.771029_3_plen_1532_part_00
MDSSLRGARLLGRSHAPMHTPDIRNGIEVLDPPRARRGLAVLPAVSRAWQDSLLSCVAPFLEAQGGKLPVAVRLDLHTSAGVPPSTHLLGVHILDIGVLRLHTDLRMAQSLGSPKRASEATGMTTREKIYVVGMTTTLLVTVAALGVSLYRANDELGVLRSHSEEMHRRLAALEGAQHSVQGQLQRRGSVDDGTNAPRGRALQDGDCPSASDDSELAVRTAFTVKHDLLVLSASMGDKADSLAAEAGAAALLANGCEASETEPATVCEPPADGLVGSGCTVTSGDGTCTVVPHTCATSASTCPLTVALVAKADQSALDTLTTAVGEKAVAADMTAALAQKADEDTVTAALAEKADIGAVDALATQLGSAPPPPVEVTPCSCSKCASDDVDTSLCTPFGPATPCECEESTSIDPVRQVYPMTQSNPPCCRETWSPDVTVTQIRTSEPQEFDDEDVVIKVGGQVTFAMTGFENVEQVHDFVDYLSVSDGIRSGDPANAGTYTHTFDAPGVYYFRSQVHESLQVTITVMDCVSCAVVTGYDGTDLATLAQALSSRGAGSFQLAIAESAMMRIMTYLTIYDGQTLTFTGTQMTVDRLALIDATVSVLAGGSLVVDAVHVSGGVTVAAQGTLQDNTARVGSTAESISAQLTSLTSTVAHKAEITALSALSSTVEQKAEATELNTLAATVDTFETDVKPGLISSKSAFDTFAATVQPGLASTSEVTTLLAAKADADPTGLAVPKVDLSTSITAAPVSAVDATTDTITLAVADSSIVAGQTVQLVHLSGTSGPAISGAAIASIDEAANTITLDSADSSIATGQRLRLADAASQSCSAAPKSTDLVVSDVSEAVITFSTDITGGDSSASTNCVLARAAPCSALPLASDLTVASVDGAAVQLSTDISSDDTPETCALSRAEGYYLPPCAADGAPRLIFTQSSGDNGLQIPMACSIMRGVVGWREVKAKEVDYNDAVWSFFSAVAASEAGSYSVTVTSSLWSVITDLTIQPMQVVTISGLRSLSDAPSWGSGGFTVGEMGSLSLGYLKVETVIQMSPGALALSLDSCVLTFAAALVLRSATATFLNQEFSFGIEVPEGVNVAIADSSLTFAGSVSAGLTVQPGGSVTVTNTHFVAAQGVAISLLGDGSLSVESSQVTHAGGSPTPIPCDGTGTTCASSHQGSVVVSGPADLSRLVCDAETQACSPESCVRVVTLGGVYCTASDCSSNYHYTNQDLYTFDPNGDSWLSAGDLPTDDDRGARMDLESDAPARVAVLGTRIFAFQDRYSYQRSQYVAGWAFDTQTSSWSAPLPPLPNLSLEHITVVGLDTTVYVIGGHQGSNPQVISDVVYAYDIVTEQWSTVASMGTGRTYHGAVACGSHIYVLGGRTPAEDYALSAEMYDPATDQWSAIAPMSFAHHSNRMASIAVVGPRIYVVDGTSEHAGEDPVVAGGSVEVYDTVLRQWSQVAKLGRSLHSHGVVVLGANLYALGGSMCSSSCSTVRSRMQTSVMKYDTAGDAWTYASDWSLPRGMERFAAVAVPMGCF